MGKMKLGTNMKGILAGILAALAVSAVLSAIFAALVSSGALPLSAMWILAVVISLFAGFLCGFVSASKFKKQKLPFAILTAGIYLLLIFVLRGLCFRDISDKPWLVLIAVVVGAVVGAVLASGKKKRR